MLWVKALHIIFMVTWFAGLFYLPRLFVYHAQSDDVISQQRFKIMERKLFWGITTPGGILTILFGVWLISYMPSVLTQGWFHAKLFLVVLLVLYHIFCGKLLKDFKLDRNSKSHVWFRWFNEAPVIALVIIILLVEIQGF
ncbi:MAG: protoporphyrinogen oxidase HemJ [Gammaproteobacteria bacterium]|nr:protoporphyrinogen oxidase HemJ [Gammaproteobacteria bacterium]